MLAWLSLEQGADLHLAQLMPLPLTVSCSSKSRLALPVWYRLTWVVPNKGPLNARVCVYLVDFQQTDEEFDLFLRDAVDDLAVVANQLGDHLGHVQTYVALQRRHTPTHRQHHHSLASTQEQVKEKAAYTRLPSVGFRS